MNTGWITLNLLTYIKYYINIDINLLKWVMILMDIVIYIWIDIGQWIISVKYSNDILGWRLVSKFIWYLIHNLMPNIQYTQHIDTFSLALFPIIKICTRHMENFDKTKYLVVYIAKTYSMIAGLPGVLQPPFFKPLPKFLNYHKRRNTYQHIVMFRTSVVNIMDIYWNNIELMKGNIIINGMIV